MLIKKRRRKKKIVNLQIIKQKNPKNKSQTIKKTKNKTITKKK